MCKQQTDRQSDVLHFCQPQVGSIEAEQPWKQLAHVLAVMIVQLSALL